MQNLKIQSTAIPPNWIAKPPTVEHYSYLQWRANLQQFQFFIYKTKKS